MSLRGFYFSMGVVQETLDRCGDGFQDVFKSARDRLVMLPKWFGVPFITARGFF